MADTHLRIKLASAESATEDEFRHAESGHQCNPDETGCQRVEDGTILKVKRAKDGSLILGISNGPKAK